VAGVASCAAAILVTRPMSAKSGANLSEIFVVAPRCAYLFRVRS
jgi:hypothetical protein